MPDWLKDLATAGPAAIFAVMWWLERSERKDNAEKFWTAMVETKSALQALSSLLKPNGGRP